MNRTEWYNNINRRLKKLQITHNCKQQNTHKKTLTGTTTSVTANTT